MSLEFKPTIKSINIASEDMTKITLEVKNGSLDGQYEDLRKLSGKTVLVAVLPETYAYVQPFDRSTNSPVQEWIINTDGTAEIIKKEQTQLELDEKGNIDIENRTKKVNRDLIDEYILAAKTLEFPGIINPRDVISRMKDGEDLGDIADDYEMSDSSLISEIEKARQHFAPFADYWDKHRDEIVFQDTAATEEPDEEEPTPDEVGQADDETEASTEPAAGTEDPDSENDSADSEAENENETDETNTDEGDSAKEDDPY